MNLYPYTDFHELNDDWIIEHVKQNETNISAIQNTIVNLNFEFDRKADKATTYTKSEVNTLLSGKVDNATLSNYYDKSDTDTLLAGKVDNATLTNYYNKNETNSLLSGKVDNTTLSNYYNKSETNTLLASKADTSSLANVATSGNYNDLTNRPKLLSSDNIDYSQFTWDDTSKRYVYTYNVPTGKELIGVLVTSKNAPQGIAVMNGYYNAGINTIMITGWNVPLATPITSSYQFICNVILRDL